LAETPLSSSEITLPDEASTLALGRAVASAVGDRAVFALSGQLGAGKTTLVKGIAQGLSVAEPVVSPTFTMLNEYVSGRLPLYHFDLYRLGDGEAAGAAGQLVMELHELLAGRGVVVLEWAEYLERFLPDDRVSVRLEYTGDGGRRAWLSAGGEQSRLVVGEVARMFTSR